MTSGPGVRVRRVYEDPTDRDGTRILVDRVWPRGVTRQAAAVDLWCRAVSPSARLRKWYGHEPARFDEFVSQYHAELQDPQRARALDHLRTLAGSGPVTLVTATRDPGISHAAVLADLIRG